MFPAVRNAAISTLIIADGFSCREQILQDTPRQALHTAEVMQMAIHPEDSTSYAFPEQAITNRRVQEHRQSMKRAGVFLGLILAGAALLLRRSIR